MPPKIYGGGERIVCFSKVKQVKNSSTASINVTVVVAKRGTLFNIAFSNIGTAARYIKLYDKATTPVPASDVPLLAIPVAANTANCINFGEYGFPMLNGIAYTVTGAAGDTDTTAIGANEVKLMISHV